MNTLDNVSELLSAPISPSMLQSKGTGLLDFFYTLSSLELGLMFVGVGLLLSTVIPYSIRIAKSIEPNETTVKGAEEAFKAIISLTFLIMAFCLVRVHSDHRSVDDMVNREATIVMKMDRAFRSYGGDEGLVLRQNLFDYADAVVTKEWPKMAKSERSQEASTLLTTLGDRTKSLDPQTAQQQVSRAEILAAFTQLSDLREARLVATNNQLPDYFWHAIATVLTILMVLGWFQGPNKKAVLYVGGVTVSFAIFLTILVSTSSAFKGAEAIKPTPLIRALVTISNNMELDYANKEPTNKP